MTAFWRKSALAACLFDLDGTLIAPSIDFRDMHRRVVAVVERYGLPAERFAGMHVLEIIVQATRMLAVQGDGSAARLEAESRQTVADIEMAAAERVEPYDGVGALLGWLRENGTRVGIVTRNGRLPVARIMERIDLPHDVLLTRDDVPFVKPDPRHLLGALERLQQVPAQSIMVGDHPMDIQAGRRAGMATVAVLSSGTAATAFAAVEPDLVLAGVTDLWPVLRA